MARARRQRREQTVGEGKLWIALRALKVKFRRQVPIGPYIADFAHHGSRLVVEVDGYYHTTDAGSQRDLARDGWFADRGYRVVRFADSRILDELDAVVAEIELLIGGKGE